MAATEPPTADGRANWETPCQKRADGQHCNCWYDGDACCACNDPPAVWCKNCGYHVFGGMCGYDTPCGEQS
jgi:hypothetical protein